MVGEFSCEGNVCGIFFLDLIVTQLKIEQIERIFEVEVNLSCSSRRFIWTNFQINLLTRTGEIHFLRAIFRLYFAGNMDLMGALALFFVLRRVE